MTPREVERRRDDRPNPDDHCVLPFKDWCALNGISVSTGRRILASENGPVVTQLSPRRIGITNGNNRAWQASRARGEV